MDPFNYKKLTRNASTCDSNNKSVINFHRKCKSLPNISIQLPSSPTASSSTTQVQTNHSKGLSRPKILKKTWDKVKGIIHHSSSTTTQQIPPKSKSSISAPSTPQLQPMLFEFEEDQQQKIARNYELLQKRLDSELNQRMTECTSNNYKLDGLSEEFRKRLVDWENWKAGKEKPQPENHHNHSKELQWLDKQLEKIEREKKRLEREMNKYLEREARLEKMKEALNSSVGGCIISTPTAKCRVEKIDEKFAKKLYEWEEKQGVSVDSSGFGLLIRKYAEEECGGDHQDHDQDHDQGQEIQGNRDRDVEDEDDEEVVLGPLDLINARLKDEEEDQQVRRAMEDVAEAMALADEMMMKCNSGGAAGQMNSHDGRISSTASSCCCSDYDHTDSKHSNTDSEIYKSNKRVSCGGLRRVSSDAGSARSLSAFTSDDDEDEGSSHQTGNTKKGGATTSYESSQHRDAESQTEVVLKAKQIVVDDDDDENNDDTPGVFVQTKRTIFAPVMDDGGKNAVVIQPSDRDPTASCSSSSGLVLPLPIIRNTNLDDDDDDDLDKPVVVGIIPKLQPTQRVPYKPQPKTQFHRSFPNSSKAPVWCSPLVARRQFNNDDSTQQRGTSRVLRKYTIGGGFMPQNKTETTRSSQVGLLTRSNSFGLRGPVQSPSNLELDSRSMMSSSSTSVSKSKSTGSIRHRFKMWFGSSKQSRSGSREEESLRGMIEDGIGGVGNSNDGDDQQRSGSSGATGGFSLRRIGSWVYKKGDEQ